MSAGGSSEIWEINFGTATADAQDGSGDDGSVQSADDDEQHREKNKTESLKEAQRIKQQIRVSFFAFLPTPGARSLCLLRLSRRRPIRRSCLFLLATSRLLRLLIPLELLPKHNRHVRRISQQEKL